MKREPFYEEIIQLCIEKTLSKEELHQQKLVLARKHNMQTLPSDINILLEATLEERKQMRLLSKPMRTQAGVSPVAIMSAPFKCPHGKCTFCPDHLKEGIPMSYTGKEPASMRGLRWGWDAYLQTMNRLEQYVLTGHNPQKCEVIIMGGTMPSYPITYQKTFIKDMFKALNDFSELFYPEGELDLEAFKEFFEVPGNKKDPQRIGRVERRLREQKETNTQDLEAEKTRNERSEIRCVGLTFETRPDCGLLPHGNLLLELGATRIELGVQTVHDESLLVTNRAHDAEMNKESTRILRDLGFKLNFHLMPGLPGADKKRILYEKDLEGMKQIFSDEGYRPDMIKLYPCMVMPNTPLAKDYEKGIFEPMRTEEAIKLLRELMPEIPEYCRIMRVQRDIPTYRTTAGVDKTNLRQMVNEKPVLCRDIRSREVKGEIVADEDIEIVVREYEASGGKEFFISAEDTKQDILIGFCRLRYPGTHLREEITEESALIRELHVYGHATPLEQDGIIQHRGWGKKLLQKAEEIAKQDNKKKMVVISGVGVRAYYIDKHGYEHDGPYVSKQL
ncbi:MAG: tRNA uridine(34) 5-carboxymethylaminomethyl modification radical SAM/GNAT enzyme Elp3 [Candidatus Woesearchaeota archaeon]